MCIVLDGDILSDEDFLTQLSAELDIPMLLNQNGSDFSFDTSDNDLLSEVNSCKLYYSNIKTIHNVFSSEYNTSCCFYIIFPYINIIIVMK